MPLPFLSTADWLEKCLFYLNVPIKRRLLNCKVTAHSIRHRKGSTAIPVITAFYSMILFEKFHSTHQSERTSLVLKMVCRSLRSLVKYDRFHWNSKRSRCGNKIEEAARGRG